MKTSILITIIFVLVSCAKISEAGAGYIYPVDCFSGTPQDEFGALDGICVSGQVENKCPGIPYAMPGAHIYAVPYASQDCAQDPFNGEYVKVSGPLYNFYSVEILKTKPTPAGWYNLVVDEKCDTIYEPGVDWCVTGAFLVTGVCNCTDPPPGYQPEVDPSGGKCRGACGAGCPFTCMNEFKNICIDQAEYTHCHCYYPTRRCPTHQGCRDHDACYDSCLGYPIHLRYACYRECDARCVKQWGFFTCIAWLLAGGPMDGTIDFAAPPTSAIGPEPGNCPSIPY